MLLGVNVAAVPRFEFPASVYATTTLLAELSKVTAVSSTAAVSKTEGDSKVILVPLTVPAIAVP